MNIDDFEKSKRELEKEKELNNKQIDINDERYRMVNYNRLEYKFMFTSVFSMLSMTVLLIPSAILINVLGPGAITNILPGFSYPIAMLGSSLAIGTIWRILSDKKYKLKERFKSFSNAKTEAEKIEEEVHYQIELEKTKNRDKAINESIEVLNSNQSMLSRISSKYELIDKNESQPTEETEKKVEELSAVIEEQYKELDIYSTQNVLHNRFWKVRKDFGRKSNIMISIMMCGVSTMLFASCPFLLMAMADIMPKTSSLLVPVAITFAPFVTGIIGGSVYTFKTNKYYKNLFNKLNSQLGENALEENQSFEMSVEEQEKIESMIKNQIRNISLTQVQLQESKRYLDACMTEEDKKKAILEQDFPKLEITEKTREDVLNNPEKYTSCDARIRMGKFYTDEEYEKYIESSLNRPLPSEEEKGPKLVKKINLNNKNN